MTTIDTLRERIEHAESEAATRAADAAHDAAASPASTLAPLRAEANAALNTASDAIGNATDKARQATQSARDLVARYPVAAAVGGLAAGAVVAGIATRALRRKPRGIVAQAEHSETWRRVAALAASAGQIALDYAARARDTAHEAGNEAQVRAEHLASDLAPRLSETAGAARKQARKLSDRALRSTEQLLSRLQH